MPKLFSKNLTKNLININKVFTIKKREIMLITPINSINYNQYKYYKSQNKSNNVSFTGLQSELQRISPLNAQMEKFLKRYKYISKNRIYPVDKEIQQSLQIITLKTRNNVSKVWDINPDNSDKYIIFYHGLGQNISSNQEFYKSALKKGYGLLAPEYGGFGDSIGSISEKSIKENTQSVIKYLASKGIKPENTGIVGFSMGSFPALTIAQKNEKFKFLILISPFNSIKNEKELLLNGNSIKLPETIKFLINKFPFLINLADSSFQNLQKIKKIKFPVYFIQAENDTVIPLKSTKELAKNSKNLKEFILLKTGGHSIEHSKIDAFNNLNGI